MRSLIKDLTKQSTDPEKCCESADVQLSWNLFRWITSQGELGRRRGTTLCCTRLFTSSSQRWLWQLSLLGSCAPSKTWIGDSFAWQRNSAWTNIEETKIALEVKVTFSFPGSWLCSSHDTLCLLWRSLGFHTWSYKVTRQMIITTNAIHAQTRPCKNPERPRRLSRNPIPDHSIPCRGS